MTFRPDETRLLPLDFEHLSKPVKAANIAAHQAADEHAAAFNHRNEINAKLERAAAADQAAAAAALDRGEKLPKPSEPKLRADLAEAEVAVDAAWAQVKRYQRELYGAIEREYESYVTAAEHRAEDAAIACRAKVDELAEAIVGFRQANASYQASRTFRAANPRATPISARGLDRFGAAFEKALTARRRTLAVKRNATITPELESVLAALIVEVEHSLAGQAANSHDRPDPALLRHQRPSAELANGELRADAVRERLEAEGYKPPRPRPAMDRGRAAMERRRHRAVR